MFVITCQKIARNILIWCHHHILLGHLKLNSVKNGLTIVSEGELNIKKHNKVIEQGRTAIQQPKTQPASQSTNQLMKQPMQLASQTRNQPTIQVA